MTLRASYPEVAKYGCMDCNPTVWFSTEGLRQQHREFHHETRLLTMTPPTERDINAARLLLGGDLNDDPKMFHASGGRLAGVAQCIHSLVEYGEYGVYRHHVWTPANDSELPSTYCVCEYEERSRDGRAIHQACWLERGN